MTPAKTKDWCDFNRADAEAELQNINNDLAEYERMYYSNQETERATTNTPPNRQETTPSTPVKIRPGEKTPTKKTPDLYCYEEISPIKKGLRAPIRPQIKDPKRRQPKKRLMLDQCQDAHCTYTEPETKKAKLSEENKQKILQSHADDTVLHETKNCQYVIPKKRMMTIPAILQRRKKAMGVQYTEPITSAVTTKHRELLPKTTENNIHVVTARTITQPESDTTSSDDDDTPGRREAAMKPEYVATLRAAKDKYSPGWHRSQELVVFTPDEFRKANQYERTLNNKGKNSCNQQNHPLWAEIREHYLAKEVSLICRRLKASQKAPTTYKVTNQFTPAQFKEARDYLRLIKTKPMGYFGPCPGGTLGTIIDYYTHQNIYDICQAIEDKTLTTDQPETQRTEAMHRMLHKYRTLPDDYIPLTPEQKDNLNLKVSQSRHGANVTARTDLH